MAKVISSIPSGTSIHNNLSGLNDGNYIHLTQLEKDKLNNIPSIFIEDHSDLNLDDGTNPHGTTKTDIGLSNVDNTSDANKPLSSTQQLYIDSKITQTITDGDTTHSPSADIVHDELILKQNLPTGFVSGLGLSIHPTDNTKAIIAAGGYVITDFTDVLNIHPVVIEVTTPIEFTPAFLGTSPSTYVALDINKNIISSATPFENASRRTLCLIGNVVHSNLTNINAVNEIKAPIIAPTNQLHDFIKAIGFLNLDGNLFTANGANLSLNKSAGRIFGMGINGSNLFDPHRLSLPEQTALTFRYRLSVSPVIEFANTTILDPTQYEITPGVLAPLTNNNRWAIHHLYIFQSGIVRIQPPQHEYSSFPLARNAAFTETFTVEQNIADNAIFRCLIIMKKTCTNLSADILSGDAEILHVGKFGNAVGGSSSALTLANIIGVLGYTPENEINKTTTIIGNEASNLLFPTVKAIVDWVTSLFVTKTRTLTINGTTQDLSADRSWTISSGATQKKQFVISKHYSTYHMFAGLYLCSNQDNGYGLNNTLSSDLLSATTNATQPIVTVPYNCKLLKINIEILDNNSGIYTLGIVKYKRTNASSKTGDTSLNKVVLLEGQIGDLALDTQYVKEFTTEISLSTISAGDDVMVLIKVMEGSGGGMDVLINRFNITMLFEEI